jgi:hypothetical protein
MFSDYSYTIIKSLFKYSMFQTFSILILIILNLILLDNPLANQIDTKNNTLSIYLTGYKYDTEYISFEYQYMTPFIIFSISEFILISTFTVSLITSIRTNLSSSIKKHINLMKLVSLFEYGSSVLILISFIIFRSECISHIYKYLGIYENYKNNIIWLIQGSFTLFCFISSLWILFLMYIADKHEEEHLLTS